MQQCDEILELTSLFLDEELDDGARQRMEHHLAHCPDCTRVFAEMRALDHLFHQAPMRYAPPRFTVRAVDAAFEDNLRRNLRFGGMVLLLGTLVISSLVLMGHLDLLWNLTTFLLTPAHITNGDLWIVQLFEGLSVAGRVLIAVLDLLRGLLLGPLLLPMLLSLLSTVLLGLVLRQVSRTSLRPV